MHTQLGSIGSVVSETDSLTECIGTCGSLDGPPLKCSSKSLRLTDRSKEEHRAPSAMRTQTWVKVCAPGSSKVKMDP